MVAVIQRALQICLQILVRHVRGDIRTRVGVELVFRIVPVGFRGYKEILVHAVHAPLDVLRLKGISGHEEIQVGSGRVIPGDVDQIVRIIQIYRVPGMVLSAVGHAGDEGVVDTQKIENVGKGCRVALADRALFVQDSFDIVRPQLIALAAVGILGVVHRIADHVVKSDDAVVIGCLPAQLLHPVLGLAFDQNLGYRAVQTLVILAVDPDRNLIAG